MVRIPVCVLSVTRFKCKFFNKMPYINDDRSSELAIFISVTQFSVFTLTVTSGLEEGARESSAPLERFLGSEAV